MAMKKVQCCLCAGVLVVLFYAPDVYGSLHWCIVLTYQCFLVFPEFKVHVHHFLQVQWTMNKHPNSLCIFSEHTLMYCIYRGIISLIVC